MLEKLVRIVIGIGKGAKTVLRRVKKAFAGVKDERWFLAGLDVT